MSKDTLTPVSTQLVDTPAEPCVPLQNPAAPLTPEQRRLRAQIAAETSWANTVDRPGRTAKAREARRQKYVDQAREMHADHDVTEEFILDVAEHLRKADMRRMALKSAKVRRANSLAAKRTAVEHRRAGA